MSFFDNLFGGPPDAPNPYKTAGAQASVSAFNQYSPYGSLTYKKNKWGIPLSSTTTLSPALKRSFNLTNATRNNLLGRVRKVSQSPWQMPDNARADEVAKTMFARKMGMINPERERQTAGTRTMLEERGLPIGSEAYQSEMDRMGKGFGEQELAASQDATLAAGAEEDRLLRNSLTERAQPFNELAGFSGGTQIGVPPAGNYQAPNIGGMIQSNYDDALKSWQQGQSDLWGGLLKLGTAGVSGYFGD